MSETIFELLQISPDSDLSSVKSTFRKKIITIHPDITGNAGSSPAAQELITAYQNYLAGYEAEQRRNREKAEQKSRDFECDFEIVFGYPFSSIGLDKHILNVLSHVGEVFYRSNTIRFYRRYIGFIMDEMDTCGRMVSPFYVILSSVFSLCQVRLSILEDFTSEEYQLEVARKLFIEYISGAFSAGDPVEFRIRLNRSKETTLRCLVSGGEKLTDKRLKEELFLMTSIFLLVGEVDFI